MTRTCETCGHAFDDLVQLTFCPHQRFISDQHAAQKDRAIRLLGKRIRFAHDQGPEVEVESVAFDGMVTLKGWSGQFSPHVFVVLDEP